MSRVQVKMCMTKDLYYYFNYSRKFLESETVAHKLLSLHVLGLVSI